MCEGRNQGVVTPAICANHDSKCVFMLKRIPRIFFRENIWCIPTDDSSFRARSTRFFDFQHLNLGIHVRVTASSALQDSIQTPSMHLILVSHLLQLVQVLQPRQNNLLARLLDLSSKEHLIENSIDLVNALADCPLHRGHHFRRMSSSPYAIPQVSAPRATNAPYKS